MEKLDEVFDEVKAYSQKLKNDTKTDIHTIPLKVSTYTALLLSAELGRAIDKIKELESRLGRAIDKRRELESRVPKIE